MLTPAFREGLLSLGWGRGAIHQFCTNLISLGGKVREWGGGRREREGMVYFVESCWQPSSQTPINFFLFVSSLAACACLCTRVFRTHTSLSSLFRVALKAKERGCAMNCVASVYFNRSGVKSPQLLICKVVFINNPESWIFLSLLYFESHIFDSNGFTCSKVCNLCLLYYKQICSLQITVFIKTTLKQLAPRLFLELYEVTLESSVSKRFKLKNVF